MGGAVLTGIAVRLGGEARKGFRLTMALGHWGCGLWCWRACGGGARPRPMEHDAQPYECNQRKLVEEKMRDHGKTPPTGGEMKGFYPVSNGGNEPQAGGTPPTRTRPHVWAVPP